jgi:hypothetical protein
MKRLHATSARTLPMVMRPTPRSERVPLHREDFLNGFQSDYSLTSMTDWIAQLKSATRPTPQTFNTPKASS